MGNRRYVWIALVIAPLACGGAVDTLRTTLPPASPPFVRPDRDVLFADDFSDGLANWRADREGVWSVQNGVLKADLPDQRQLRSLLWAGDPAWRDYALDFDVCMMRGVDKGAVVRGFDEVGVGVDVRGGAYQDIVGYVREWPLGRAPAVTPDAAWNHIRIEAVGDRVRVSVNGELRLDRRQTRARHGRIALAAYTGGAGQCTVYYDNVVVSEL
jgi:hypothetical protein